MELLMAEAQTGMKGPDGKPEGADNQEMADLAWNAMVNAKDTDTKIRRFMEYCAYSSSFTPDVEYKVEQALLGIVDKANSFNPLVSIAKGIHFYKLENWKEVGLILQLELPVF
ncbi:MAG: hypothetical protein U5Q03_17950 [Bacteroidota bacterium]|nr:hypothetical protein [Bacteroidota bacterium]